MGCPQRGHSGAIALASSAAAFTLRCKASNICGLYSNSTSRSSRTKRDGLIGDPRPERWLQRFRLRQASLHHSPSSLRRRINRRMPTPLLAGEHQ